MIQGMISKRILLSSPAALSSNSSSGLREGLPRLFTWHSEGNGDAGTRSWGLTTRASSRSVDFSRSSMECWRPAFISLFSCFSFAQDLVRGILMDIV
jgi:hypothetical protein